MAKKPKITRREFNQSASRIVGAAALTSATPLFWSCTPRDEQAPTIVTDEPATEPQTQPAPPVGDITMVDPESPAAQALAYCEDAHSPEPHCPERANPERKGQYCTNCLFFTMATVRSVDGSEIEDVDAQRDIAIAECQLLPGQGYVTGPGWCRSWAQRHG